MKHIALSDIRKTPRLYLHDALTHRVIASRDIRNWHVGESRLPWIVEQLEDYLGWRHEQVETVEDDDGMEWILADGERVAYLE